MEPIPVLTLVNCSCILHLIGKDIVKLLSKTYFVIMGLGSYEKAILSSSSNNTQAFLM